jgi:recombination protein RecR
MIAQEIEHLMKLLAQLPGLGPRSGKRAALHLIKRKDTHMVPLTDALSTVLTAVQTCGVCGNIDTKSPCMLCEDHKRDTAALCIIEDVEDLWAMERANAFRGRYHVLGGVLSALDGIGPENLTIESLTKRVSEGEIQEVIIALSATMEGQTTAHYLYDKLTPFGVKITRLAHGLPIGGDLDYLDEGTIMAALNARQPVE